MCNAIKLFSFKRGKRKARSRRTKNMVTSTERQTQGKVKKTFLLVSSLTL